MKIKNLFTSGKMNKDADERLVPKGEYRDALNIRINNSNGSDLGAIENVLSNVKITELSLGSNAKCVGAVDDDGSGTIYWAVSSDQGSYVCSYNKKRLLQRIILKDTRPELTRVLNFNGISYVDMSVINDQENGKTFLVIADGVSEPKYFNVNNDLVDSSFELEDISLIKSPPLNAPSITLIETEDSENNIKDKFYSFAYRYIYENNEISALSPFSEFAFIPGEFKYDYNSGNNKSMFNEKNKARLGVNTGSKRVKKIEIIGKESDTNAYYILEKIDKQDKSLSDNATYEFDFTNNKIFKALDVSQTLRAYDNVPLNAKAVEVIGNRIVFGNYTEGYNMVNGDDQIIPKLSTSLTSTSGTSGQPHTSVKSNMDYEVGISYLDGKGRMTTPFTSEGNTVHVPISNSDKKNSLSVSISSKAPEWATNYRFFVKQSRNDYDVISPVLFYVDGVYVWIKLEGEDVNKVKNGDFLFLKSDTSGIKRSQVKVKVLDAGFKEKNFLDNPNDTNIKQESGNYIKISTENISLDISAVDSYKYEGFGFRSNDSYNNYENNQTYVEEKVFYGTGADNLSFSGTYTGITDKRFEIEVIGPDPVTLVDKIKFRELDCKENTYSSWRDNSGSGYSSASPTSIGDGITITFSSGFGHTIGDKWVISAKAEQRGIGWYGSQSAPLESDGRRAIMSFKLKDNTDETIRAGAIISIEIDDTTSDDIGNPSGYLFQRFVSSSDYPNIEEWFWGDNVITKMEYPVTTADVMFRRGSLSANREQLTINPSGTLHMCMLTQSNYVGGGRVRANFSIKIVELDNQIIFETDYKNAVSEVFYEIPGTYSIDTDGNHQGAVNQDYGVTDAVVNLQFFNCFGWYNGYESIKIADAFNEKKMLNDSKPLVPIDDYKQIKRISSLTYSNVYESTTSYNGLNEFNLSTANYKDIDANFGPIARMISSDGDITVFQSNRVSRILYNKNVIVSADGNGTITQSNNVLGQDMPYQGEYGVSKSPASVVRWDGGIFFADENRGSVLRLGANGIIPISSYGMKDWFNDNLNQNVIAVGSYDPRNDQYVIGLSDGKIEWLEDTYNCLYVSWEEDTYECVQATTTTTTTAAQTTTTTTEAQTTTTTTEDQTTTSTTTEDQATTSTTTEDQATTSTTTEDQTITSTTTLAFYGYQIVYDEFNELTACSIASPERTVYSLSNPITIPGEGASYLYNTPDVNDPVVGGYYHDTTPSGGVTKYYYTEGGNGLVQEIGTCPSDPATPTTTVAQCQSVSSSVQYSVQTGICGVTPNETTLYYTGNDPNMPTVGDTAYREVGCTGGFVPAGYYLIGTTGDFWIEIQSNGYVAQVVECNQ